MFAVVSFPIADLRGFVGSPSHRLVKPTFPTPVPDVEFVRSNGIVRSRRRGGSPAVGGEDVYCSAKAGLRFGPDGAEHLGQRADGLRMRSLFRRLYHTGSAAMRYELGFVAGRATSALDVDRVLRRIETTPVHVGDASAALAAAGPLLARSYLRATTQQRNGEPRQVDEGWCHACDGMALFEYHEHEEPTLTARSDRLPHLEHEGIQLRHVRLEGHGGLRNLWLVGRASDADPRRVRQVRMHLTRVHTEVQCFRHAVNWARTSDFVESADEGASDELEAYLAKLSGVLRAESRHGTPQKAILATALTLSGEASPGGLESVLDAASQLRRRIADERKRRLEREQQYRAQPWEKILAYSVAAVVILAVLYLVIRNEPFRDPNLVVLVRVLLSLAVAIQGAIVPGFLRLSWKGKGLLVRAGGALALFVLTFLVTPTVLPGEQG